MTIVIREIFKDDYTTRVAGEKLRNMILQTDEKVTLDFSGIKIASSSFLDEGIAKLALVGWDGKKLKQKISFVHLFSMDEILLHQVCNARGIDL